MARRASPVSLPAAGPAREPLLENALRFLFLLFLIMPILEMYVLIEVGGWIGAWPTIGLVALTAVIGVALLRQQGFSTLMRGRQRLDAGELPAREMLEGLMLAVGGALLLTPGFVTDGIGFLLLLPPTRWMLVRLLLRRGMVSVAGASFRGAGGANGFGAGGPFGPGEGPFGPDGSASGPRGAGEPRRSRSADDDDAPEVRRTRDGRHVIEGEWERRDD